MEGLTMPVIEFDQLSHVEIYTLSPDNKWVPLREFIAKAEERFDTLQEGIHKFCKKSRPFLNRSTVRS